MVDLEIEFRLVVLLRVGIDGAERLLGLYLVALLHIQFAQVGIDGAVVTMLHDNGVGVATRKQLVTSPLYIARACMPAVV